MAKAKPKPPACAWPGCESEGTERMTVSLGAHDCPECGRHVSQHAEIVLCASHEEHRRTSPSVAELEALADSLRSA